MAGHSTGSLAGIEMTPHFWHKVSLIAGRNHRKLMKGALYGILACGLVFGSLAFALWSYKWLFLGIWLIVVQLFWCAGLGIVIANYKHLPRPEDGGFLAGWNRVIGWYGAVFLTVWFSGLILATFVAPILIALSDAS